jgi:hypothetical protein
MAGSSRRTPQRTSAAGPPARPRPGSWVGTGTGLHTRDGEAEFGDVFTVAYRGRGAFDGLLAWVTAAGESDDRYHETFRGIITAHGLPPFPEGDA